MNEITDVIPVYLNYCEYQKRLDEKTRKAYRIDLFQLAGALENQSLNDITPVMLEKVFGTWHMTYKAKTVKRKVAAVRAFFSWLEEREYLTENPFGRIHVRFREPKALPKTIPEHNLERFLQTLYDVRRHADERQKQQVLRDITVIELLFSTGMRISELCSLKLNDVNLVEGAVLIHGKGRKERYIQIPDEQLLQLLQEYYNAYKDDMERNGGCFFINHRGRPLKDASVRNMIEKYCAEADISQHITPHMFRHTFATNLLEEDVNLRCIQEILGHSSIKTTEIYTHVSAAKQRAVLRDKNPRRQLKVSP